MAFIGLRDLHYALLTEDSITTLTYGTPKRIVGAITANINPNTASGTLFADDGPMETATVLGEIELELNVADLPTDVQAELLGHEVDTDGIMLRKSTDIAPYVAVGFRSLKSNGEYRYVWLVKGMFRVPEQNHETKNDDINFQTPSIVGNFLKREYDDVWQKQIDSDDPAYLPATGDNWFDAVETVGP